jgi:hypothetical protein
MMITPLFETSTIKKKNDQKFKDATEENRTLDLLFTKQMHYQLCYGGNVSNLNLLKYRYTSSDNRQNRLKTVHKFEIFQRVSFFNFFRHFQEINVFPYDYEV